MLAPFFTSLVAISALFLLTYLFIPMTIKDLRYCIDLNEVQCGSGSFPQALLSKQFIHNMQYLLASSMVFLYFFFFNAMMTNIKVCPGI